MEQILNGNDSTFDALIKKEKKLLVDFWAPTCGPCKSMEPGLEKIARDHSRELKVLKINVNQCPRTSSRFLIRTLPTLLFIYEGEVKFQLTGAVNPSQIEKALSEVF